VVEAILEIFARREAFRGYRITHQARFLRHFTARFEPVRATDSNAVL
jgi:tryptophanase